MRVLSGTLMGLVRTRKAMEQTMSGNVGGFAVPIGAAPLRRTFPSSPGAKKKKKKSYGTVVSYDDLSRHAQEQVARLKR